VHHVYFIILKHIFTSIFFLDVLCLCMKKVSDLVTTAAVQHLIQNWKKTVRLCNPPWRIDTRNWEIRYFCHFSRGQDNSVCVVTKLRIGRKRTHILVPKKDMKFVCVPRSFHTGPGLPSSHFVVYIDLFSRGWRGCSVKLTIHLHSVLKNRNLTFSLLCC
jgi:hypothetical protein